MYEAYERCIFSALPTLFTSPHVAQGALECLSGEINRWRFEGLRPCYCQNSYGTRAPCYVSKLATGKNSRGHATPRTVISWVKRRLSLLSDLYMVHHQASTQRSQIISCRLPWACPLSLIQQQAPKQGKFHLRLCIKIAIVLSRQAWRCLSRLPWRDRKLRR